MAFYSPYEGFMKPFDSFFKPFESIERRIFGTLPVWMSKGMELEPVRIKEEKDRYHVSTAIPGMGRNEIEVDVENDILTIKGSKRTEADRKRHGERTHEAGSESYYVELALPGPVHAKGSRASFKNGVLTLDLKKDKGARNRLEKLTIH